MNKLEIQARMGNVVEEQRALNDKYEEREWSAEDIAIDAKLDKEFEQLKKAENRHIKVEMREAALAKAEYTKKKIHDTSGKDAASAEIRELRAFLMNDEKALAEIRAAQSSVVNADGAYTVPTTLVNEIDKALLAFGGIRSIARTITTSTGNPLNFPTVNDTSNTGSIKAENVDTGSAAKVAFGNKQFNAYKITSGVLQIPRELVRDSAFDIVPFLVDLMVERVARKTADYATLGTGSSEPEGAVIGASAGTTAAAAALTADNILDLIKSVNSAYRRSKAFNVVMNDSTESSIMKLKDNTGDYIWKMGNIVTGAPSSIWGTPIVIDDGMPDIAADAKSVIAGDFNKYLIRQVGNGELRQSTERYFELNQLGVVYDKYVDMKVINSAAIKYLQHASS